jgi:hypothetical protein
MSRITKLTAAAAVAALALPASAADAALPKKGTFLNKSHSNGVLVETSRHAIRTVSFYCAHTRWDLVQFVDLRRDGSFSFNGQMRQYGQQGQPWGKHHARFHGRFTSKRRVVIKRKLPGACHRATVRAKRTSG